MAITNEEHIKFYKAASRLLTNRLQEENLTVSQVSTKSEQQFNTINAIVKGVPFYAHQLAWMEEHLGITVKDILREMENVKEETTLDDLI